MLKTNHHNFHLPSTSSHLRWRSCAICLFIHNRFISSVTHSLHLFFGIPTGHHPPTLTSSTSLNTPPAALLTCLNHLNLLLLSSTERSLTPHISTTSLLDLPSCHLTPAMYLSILWSQLPKTSVSLFVNAHVSAPYKIADLTQASYTFPLILSFMLRFTINLAISHHILHAATTFALTALSALASQSNIYPK
ncbi:hypothetical protein E2C01_064515 [Portunus trituberculatus]|uniref:Uncharacterized protein n=1 Tax=Portunus trituberculatus TaxID=210409 RepID=A0A5B7HJB5_PORTR|nr:hypothetical protein [Portunus trituberculatus]